MKKKLCCVFISVAILLQMFVPVYFAQDVATDATTYISDEAVRLLDALGIASKYELESADETKITRGEFAVYLGRIAGVAENASAPDVRYFVDVAQNNRFAPSVTALYEKGIVKGTENKLFEPDTPIKPFDAAVMLLRLGGYETLVKIGSDYNKLIVQNGLLNGLSMDSLTGVQAAELIFRALRMPYFNITAYGTDLSFEISDTHPIMYEYYKVYEVEGVLECAEGISISSVLADDEVVVIGGETYSADLVYGYGDLGSIVTGFVKENRDSADELVAYAVSTKNRITEIDIDKITYISDDGLTLKYQKAASRSVHTVNLPGNVNVLKNGKRVTKNISKAFEEKQGRIKVVEAPGYGVNVHIYVYDSVFVSNVDTELGVIYPKSGQKIDLEASKLVRKRVITSDGSVGTVSDVKKGMLLTVYRSDVSVEIHICTDTVSGVVSAKDKKTVTVNDTLYKVEPVLFEKLFSKLKVGASYEFYLNKNGEIAYFTEGTAKSEVGFLIDAATKTEAFSEKLLFKMMTSDGSLITITAKDKMYLNGENKTNTQILESLDETGLSGYAQLVCYDLNTEGEIRSLYTATGDEGNNHIQLDSGFSVKYHKLATRTLGNNVALKSDATIFKVPELSGLSTANEKEFEVLSAMENNTSYYSAAYSLGGESFLSDVIVISSNDVISDFNGQEHVWMFDSTYNYIDDEELERTKIVLAGVKTDGGYMKLEEFSIPVDFAVTDENRQLGDVSWNELTQGDLIRIKHNSKDELLRIRMVFDHDKEGAKVSDCSYKAEYAESLGRCVAGYANSKEDLLVALGINSPKNIDEIAYMVEGVIAVYDDKLQKDNIYVGTIDDILTYEEVGDNASVVVPVTWYKWSYMIFVYKNGL